MDIDAKFQALINAAHDATRKNTSVPLTSGQIRCEYLLTMWTIHMILSLTSDTANLLDEMTIPTNWSTFINDYYPQAVSIVEGESGQKLSNALKLRRDKMYVSSVIDESERH